MFIVFCIHQSLPFFFSFFSLPFLFLSFLLFLFFSREKIKVLAVTTTKKKPTIGSQNILLCVSCVAVGYLLGSTFKTNIMIESDCNKNELLRNDIAFYHDAAKSLTPITDKLLHIHTKLCTENSFCPTIEITQP